MKSRPSMLTHEEGEAAWQLSLFSPAKVNLFFRVIKKREDGFHDIASLYQAISLHDRLFFSIEDTDSLTCTDKTLELGDGNLVQKALALFRKKTGRQEHFRIHLQKHIPVQAGLGGGSSNGATALFAFMKLTGEKICFNTLKNWSSELGSDLPFFFSKGSAYATGRGELLEDCSLKKPLLFWIAKPTYGLSTVAVYKQCSAANFLKRDPKQSLKEILSGKRSFYNDLEEPAFALESSLSTLKQRLLAEGFSSVTMSGSGTAFFCFGKEKAPVIPGVEFFPVESLQRKEEGWYEL